MILVNRIIILLVILLIILIVILLKKITYSEHFTKNHSENYSNNFKKYDKYSNKIKTYYGECKYTPSNYIIELPQITWNGYFINDLLIYKKYRNKGFGTKILEHIIDLSRKQGKLHLISQVRSNNKYAVKLHKNLGFLEYTKGLDTLTNKEIIVFIYIL